MNPGPDPLQADTARLEKLIAELEAIRLSAYWMEGEFEAEIAKVADPWRDSARNLLHYLALRRRDIRPLQEELASLGLSSLGRSESHVLGTVEALLLVLHRLLGRRFEPQDDGVVPITFAEGRARLAARTNALFGPPVYSADNNTTHVRVMVTMPTDAATDYPMLRDLVEGGMNCMRINCAHDTVVEWEAMVRNLRQACEKTGRECKILMDLGGPKLRTGLVEPGPPIVRWQPKLDAYGRFLAPALLWLTPAEGPEPPPEEAGATLPIEGEVLRRLRVGDKIVFKDLRGRSRSIRLRASSNGSWMGECKQISYLSPDCPLAVKPKKHGSEPGRSLPGEFRAAIPPREQWIGLRVGDVVRVTREQIPGRRISRDLDGKLLEEPSIACTLPEVFDAVRPGERIVFNDGKITGTILSASPDTLRVRVDLPVEGEKKLRADKGINLPDTRLELPALTKKDLFDLDFVARHADMVGLSFVNRPADIEELQRELFRRSSRKIGVILKIETRSGFEQLPRLLLAAMRNESVGVMIARGDLAVECGYERLAELQEEILWICEAAHVPVIWATEVLDRLNKKGAPTRAEVSDAAMGERAECVMLNKGPFVVETVRVLRDILGRMGSHLEKKSPMLRALKVSSMRSTGEGNGKS